MIDLQHEVRRTVQSSAFVAQIVELVRHPAVETLQAAFARHVPIIRPIPLG
jgi:hypothetical protein